MCKSQVLSGIPLVSRFHAQVRCYQHCRSIASLVRSGLAVLCLAPASLCGQEDRDRPEQPHLGPQRLLPGQPFVGRFGEMRYQNYGSAEYPRQPPFTTTLRPFYSVLGDRLLYGSEAISWIERRGRGIERGFTSLDEVRFHGEAPEDFTDFVSVQNVERNLYASYRQLFNYVIVGTDGTDAWQSRIIYGDEIRTKFTPLTLKRANFNGLRLDLGTRRDAFSAVVSRIHGPLSLGTVEANHQLKAKAMLLGLHYQRQVGFLHFGGTFINAHQYEPLMGEGSLSLKGVPGAMQNAPSLIAIRISDDSPLDGRGGPVIHQVDIYVNGQERPELEPFIVRLFKRGEQRQPYVQNLLSSGERKPLPAVPNDYQSINRGSVFSSYDPYIGYAGFDPDLYYRGYEFPFWIDHLYYRDFKLFGPDHVINADQEETEDPITVHGEFAHEQAERSDLNPDGQFLGLHTRRDLPQAFDGREYGILYIDLEPFGEPIRSVRVDLTLANDYHIEVAEIDQAGTDLNPPGVNYKERYRYATFFRTVARAKGNPQDGTLQRLQVEAGTPTGLNLYSAHVHGVLKGFQIRAELAHSSSFSQYASGPPAPRVPLDALNINAINREQLPGKRSTVGDRAYYMAVERRARSWGFGAEYFSMGALYNTELRTYVGRDETDFFGNPIAYNNTMIHRLVEDNDDDDRFPDSWYNRIYSRYQGQADIDGVFPGTDEDRDGVPDHNRNYNGTPDHVEPFLMYDADPQDYDYGADLNHNDFIDARENDWEADYPYDPDLRGLHLYGQYRLVPDLTWTLGILQAEQIAGSSPSKVRYTRFRYERQVPSLGRFLSEASLEKVEDGVEDPLSVYSEAVLTEAQRHELFRAVSVEIAPFAEQRREDPLNYQNSTLLRLFTDARWQTVPHLNMRNKVKVEVNFQRGGPLWDGREQQSDRRRRLTMVHKIDYHWQLASKLSLFSGFKFRYLKEWRQSQHLATRHERYVIPLIKLEYRLTERSRFQFGMQGFGTVLPYSATDLVDVRRDFKQRDTVLMMTNDSKYFGYLISTNVGLRHRVKEFDHRNIDVFAGERFFATFINIILGFEKPF